MPSSVLASCNIDASNDSCLRQTFDFFDIDQSGAISASEFRQAMLMLGHKATDEETAKMIGSVDKDGNGNIDFKEFASLLGVCNAQEITEKEMKEFFSGVDKDGSGYITTAELRHHLTSLGQSANDSDMDSFMCKYDMDGSGQLTLDEFEELLEDMGFKIAKDDDSGAGASAESGTGPAHSSELPRLLGTGINNSSIKQVLPMKDQVPLLSTHERVNIWGHIMQACGQLMQRLCQVQTHGRTHGQPVPIYDKLMPTNSKALKDTDAGQILKPFLDEQGNLIESRAELLHELMKNAKELLQSNGHCLAVTSSESDDALHWEKGRIKRGLGEVIHKANHIALIVSDVGKSATFYSEVIGLQQIRRPDFDRHGAWFTMGNLELHLIKGVPLVHSGNDLIVNHISIETHDIDRVPGILRKLGVPFRQNVSVPAGKRAQGSGTNTSNDHADIVKQYFLRDPDGYFLEICNCDVLTKYCLGADIDLTGYDHGAGSFKDAAAGAYIGMKIANSCHNLAEKERALLQHPEAKKLKGGDLKEIAQFIGCKQVDTVDDDMLNKLLVRRTVYGDLCQGSTPDELKGILRLAGNNKADAMRMMQIRAGDDWVFQPPAFFDSGNVKVTPEALDIHRCTDGKLEVGKHEVGKLEVGKLEVGTLEVDNAQPTQEQSDLSWLPSWLTCM